MTTQEKRWARVKDPELDRLYVRLEKIIDAFLGAMDMKVVQQIEKDRMVAEGSIEKMDALCSQYIALWGEMHPKGKR